MKEQQSKSALDSAYWQQRYASAETGWDLGGPNEGLLREALQYVNTSSEILIPGAGRGYEAQWLWKHGYSSTFVCDWASEAFDELRKSSYLPDENRLLVSDFFRLTGTYDLLLEQTFFCAIDPSMREAYASHAASLLKPGGYLIGVLFDRSFPQDGPPFGGDREEYHRIFASHFEIEDLNSFSGSVGPRLGTEVLLVARKS